ncbi:MAG: Regulatory protein RecX [Chlamydiae bacterium]|nr:Regulatory protein RecX [Chlamydiota bacterium]
MIVEWKKEHSKVKIYVEGELWRSVSPRLFGKNPDFDVQNLKELEELEYRQTMLFAVRSLSAKAQHSTELRKKLRDLGASSSAIEQVLSELQRLGYLDDDEWLDFYVRAQISRNLGKYAIQQKLRMKGIPLDQCEELLDRYLTSESQEEQIKSLLKTKYRHKDLSDPKQKQQVIAALARRGFSWELVQSVLLQD